MTTLDGFEALRRTVTGDHDQGPEIINLELIVERIQIERPDIPDVSVEMTGGGIATIYCGVAYFLDKAGQLLDAQGRWNDPRIETVCYPVLAGPGWFTGPDWIGGRSYREEFSIGYDGNDPEFAEDEGYSDWLSDPVTERDMARLMVRLYDKHPRRVRKEIP